MNVAGSYDLLVIGSGPAGEKGAVLASYFGKRVALIEKEPHDGGAATNTGTLPSKTLRETALFLSGFRNRDLRGLNLNWSNKAVSVRDFMARERLVVDHERRRIAENLLRHRVTRHQGAASFADDHTLAVRQPDGGDLFLRGDVILIATGSTPYRPPGFRFEDPRIYDSDEILDLCEIPRSMTVVGGGVIGCEYACMFNALDVDVTIVEKEDRLLGFMDAEVSRSMQFQMERNGIRLRLKDSVDTVGDACLPFRLTLKSGAILEAHSILISSGRNGNTAALGLDRVGIAVQKRGLIRVNEHYQTTVPHIYAAGDVIGFPALASTSMEQARLAVLHAFGPSPRRQFPATLPYGIYSVPECSMAGATEEALKAEGVDYVVGKAAYQDNARGRIIGDDHGFLKLLFRRDDMKLLGVHIIGEQATELIHLGLHALQLGETEDLFINTCFNYPTLTELYKYAAFDAHTKRDALPPGRPEPPAP